MRRETKILLITSLFSILFILLAGINLCNADTLLGVPEIAQEHDQWCWDASGHATLQYYGTDVAQCDIANWAWGRNDCCGNSTFDWTHPCNQPNTTGSLHDILAHWGVNSTEIGAALSQTRVVSEINAGRPFEMRWGWCFFCGGGGHMLVGRGYDLNGQYLDYMDPWPGHGYTKSLYTWVVHATLDHDWTDSLQITTIPKPNLTSYKPSTWTDKIVVSKTTGSNSDSSLLYSTDTLYVDWAIINNGPGVISKTFYIRLYIDGALKASWPVSSLPANHYIPVTDFNIGKLSPGSHEIKVVADATGVISETNEEDNDYTKNITVVAAEPTLLINSSISSTRAQGGAFYFSGSNYTPGGTVSRYLTRPGESEVPISSITASSGGTLTNWPSYSSTCSDKAGTYTLRAYDNIKNQWSNTVSEVITANSSCNPTLLINGSTSSTKTQGGTFTTTGTKYTPNGSITRYLQQPGGATITLPPTLYANSSGNINWTYTSDCTTATGTYKIWVVDDATGRTSNTATQVITASLGSLSSSSKTFTRGGGSGSVNVTKQTGCGWTAVSNAYWLAITSGSSGTGNGTVNYSVSTNSGGTRTATMTIAGKTFTVTQYGGCTFSISPTSMSVDGGFHEFDDGVTVTTQTGCYWQAEDWASPSWMWITRNYSGTGNGTVSVVIDANNSGAARTGTMTIAGKTFTVKQASCAYALSPTGDSFGTDGGYGLVNVMTGLFCEWKAVSNASWITILSGSTEESGSPYYYVTPNSGAARTGTMTIAGKTFTVTQVGNSGGLIEGTP